MSAQPTEVQEGQKITHHFGRGGAGNMTAKPRKDGVEIETTPILKSRNYTTGRGGTGNIVSNDSSENARKAQDVDVPGIVMPEGEHHVGRGGGGNVYKQTEEEELAARKNNEQVRRTSVSGGKSGIKGALDKVKDVLKPNDPPSNTA